MNTKNRNLIIGGLIIALIIAVMAPFLASSNPDGLESSAESLEVPESEAAYTAPLPDYAIPGMEDNPLGGVVALIVGTIVVLLVVLGVATIIGKRKKNGTNE
ncbi:MULTISPECIES: PDGLE domain-containing protein [Methanobacterium]|jgi:cobalt/nickel transport protein|uniref:Cobalamin biosynthesis protein CbiN n=1 Tax=Methanobacterium subterraneum TaxID=59277 RepID=A0A2H4VML2_9EURY|nr:MULTISPECIES: PDGLE domain-containing protein [Methanobacterium]MBW4257026.1 PDGLE domain-containing protein [Methanobacterium sp. YSL]AUB54659.1 cobalamin biosynthesis protein CbiN [Methanobacterium subterraneum]AUB58362.1 cobalamin biosynthesis protein CbiN [Methanobacterium sp. MZ-A1]AUB59343.1 cobalamin biosynthesis protein CbiN [Methanobacterium subterraneum]MCC7560520.1 PDGLE domain-containing protein [Methanobacterium sp.]